MRRKEEGTNIHKFIAGVLLIASKSNNLLRKAEASGLDQVIFVNLQQTRGTIVEIFADFRLFTEIREQKTRNKKKPQNTKKSKRALKRVDPG